MLEELSWIVSKEKNEELNRTPSKEEVRVVEMGFNRHSTGGPDGITCAFY